MFVVHTSLCIVNNRNHYSSIISFYLKNMSLVIPEVSMRLILEYFKVQYIVSLVCGHSRGLEDLVV